MSRPSCLVDVFGVVPFSGGSLAIVSDAEGLDTEDMQHVANWTNLSETAVLLPDHRLRAFTTVHEMPFARHHPRHADIGSFGGPDSGFGLRSEPLRRYLGEY